MSGRLFGRMAYTPQGDTITIVSVISKPVKFTHGFGRARFYFGSNCLPGSWLVTVWIREICLDGGTGMLLMFSTLCFARPTLLKIGCIYFSTTISVCEFGTTFRYNGSLGTLLSRFSSVPDSNSTSLSLLRLWSSLMAHLEATQRGNFSTYYALFSGVEERFC